MSESTRISAEFWPLLDAVCDSDLADSQVDELAALLSSDPAALEVFLDHIHLRRSLQSVCRAERTRNLGLARIQETLPHARSSSPSPIVINVTPASASYSLQSIPFAYLVACIVVGFGLLIASLVRVSHPGLFVRDRGVPPTAPVVGSRDAANLVGRITGAVDCRWGNASTALDLGARVPMGHRYVLSSGLLEITYDTGARVILQGPVTYEVESPTGGYLSVGKLTAKLEKRSAVSDRRSDPSNPQSLIPNPLFAVRTPTAMVTDLGTEFGVEVDKSGETTSHVFRGSVQVQLTSRDGLVEGVPRVLHENESVRVSTDSQEKPAFVSVVSDASTFVRRLPGRIPIKLFSTGVGLKEGQPDPHWQLVAVSNDPNFKPRPAVVAKPVEGLWMPNAPKRPQWISAAGDSAPMPNGVTYTFRTTFELRDARPETARLRGWFTVDNHVRAMRLNGRTLDVPRHEYDRFNFAYAVSIADGFVEGMNVLEVDVENVPQPAGVPNHAAADSVATTLFRDDFETAIAASTRNYPDDSGDYDPTGASPGKWTVNENDPNAVQVTSSNVPPDPGADQGAKCLRLRRAIDGKDVAFAEAKFSEQTAVGDRLHISAMVYVPAAEQATDAAMQVTVGSLDGNYINLIANFDGHRSIVSRTRSGVSHDAGIDFVAGRWQKWEIDYNIGAEACSLRIGDGRATAIPVDPVTFIDRVAYWAHFNAGTPVYIDDVLVRSEAGPMGLRVELGGTVQPK